MKIFVWILGIQGGSQKGTAGISYLDLLLDGRREQMYGVATLYWMLAANAAYLKKSDPVVR
jgi:hypothetical protein